MALPTPVVRQAGAARVYSFTPMTTVWTPPASCATNVPTIYAGTCNTQSCSAYSQTYVASHLSSVGAYVNYPQYSANGAMTSTSCMPPGYQALESFFFQPATACPESFMTATVSTGYTSNTVVCCPSGYPTPTYLTGDAVFDCYTLKSITAGEPFTLVAQGRIPTSASNLNGWISESIISTTAWPAATSAKIFHPGVNLLMPGGSATPTPGSGTDGTGFSVFSLGLGASIAILAAIGIVGLCFLGCCICLLRVCCYRRARIVPVQPPPFQQQQQQQQWQQQPPTVVQYYPEQQPYTAPPQYQHK